MIESSLFNIGLTKKEVEVYLYLLNKKPLLASELAESIKLNRTNSYGILKNLIDKGLVTHVIRNNRKYFSATRNTNLLRYLENKETDIKEQKREIAALLPTLDQMYPTPNKEEDSVEVYEGKEGIKAVLEDILHTKKDILSYGSQGGFTRVLSFYFKHYMKRLLKTKIHLRLVFNRDPKQSKIHTPRVKVRYLPAEYASPTETTIYGNKVVLFLFTQNPRAILIQSQAISDTYRNYFELIWNNAK